MEQTHERFEGRNLVAESIVTALFEIAREHQHEEAEKEQRGPQSYRQNRGRRKTCEQRFAGIENGGETINAGNERESLNEPAQIELDHKDFGEVGLARMKLQESARVLCASPASHELMAFGFQILLDVHRCLAAHARGSDGLAIVMIRHVARGEHALHARHRVMFELDVAHLVRFNLPA